MQQTSHHNNSFVSDAIEQKTSSTGENTAAPTVHNVGRTVPIASVYLVLWSKYRNHMGTAPTELRRWHAEPVEFSLLWQ